MNNSQNTKLTQKEIDELFDYDLAKARCMFPMFEICKRIKWLSQTRNTDTIIFVQIVKKERLHIIKQ